MTMKRIAAYLSTLLLTAAAQAQTLNVVTGNITYQYPVASLGDMTYSGGTSLTILGKTFAISDITKIYVESSQQATDNLEDNQVAVTYNGNTAAVTVAGNVATYVTPTVSGGHVSIAQSNTDAVDGDEITYTLSGTTTDGEFALSGSYKCTVALNGVTLNNPSGAAINITNGKRIQVSAKKGTVNTLTDGTDGTQKACLYSKGQIQLQGNGTLNVKGNTAHAIKSGDYISVKNLTLNVTGAVNDGINCNEYFLMKSGTVTISGVADDGIQTDLDGDTPTAASDDDHSDEDTGNLYIEDGSLTITTTGAATKGLKAEGSVSITGGTLNITTTGNGTYDEDDQDTKACAGISADADISIAAGTLTLKSTGSGGKCIKCDGTLTISGDANITAAATGSQYKYSSSLTSSAKAIKVGTKTLKSGRTANSHKKSNPAYDFTGGLVITGGTLNASASSHEAIESKSTIDISGGIIYAQSTDDAINSASTFTISGGQVCGYSTGNDGLDANGDFYIKGGTVYAIASGGAEVGIDANSEGGFSLTLTGGNVATIGGLENGSTLSQTCYQLGSSNSSGGNNGRGGGGGFGGFGGGGSQSWSANTWYGLYSNGSLAIAFKTPSSGGSALVVSTSGTATLSTGVSVSGTTIWNGMGATSASGGSSATLSTYSGGNNGGGGGRMW